MVKLNNDWDGILSPLFSSQNYLSIRNFLKHEYANYTVYPNMYDIFNCFKLTPYGSVKVVILGQDPYHEVGQAQGVSFSVPKGFKLPPSLKNIYKELNSDLNVPISSNGDLTKWAKQGVLLLNTVLTVREGQPNSHKKCGWELFTDEVIKLISQKNSPVVFILWGANARAKKQLISSKHHIIESAHPSPLSAHNGFFGSKPFSKTNEFLIKDGLLPIDWDLNN